MRQCLPVRREIRTTSPSRSIWQPPLTEEAFRHTAVDLALATNECPVDADIGLKPLPCTLHAHTPLIRPLNTGAHKSQHVLPLEIEHRLTNDIAFISATQEAVFSVTAVCIEEHPGPSGALESVTLRLAANEGISESLKTRLLGIWAILTAHPHEPAQTLATRIFEEIVRLNRTRILQRARKAVGHPPIFREKGRIRTNPDDKLLRAFARMRKEKLTPIGHGFVDRATALNTQLLHLLETVSVDEAEAAPPEALAQLSFISQQCFDVATSCGDGTRLPFKHLLAAAGLDQRTWLKNKHVVEIDKIGAYWRIARSLVYLHRHITTKCNPKTHAPVRLRVEGIQPYTSTTLSLSIQGRPMPCYVHAEVQLLVHYLLSHSPSYITDPALSPPSPPRVIGASKSACFLCHLFIRAFDGPSRLEPPATHGRLYDQWTIPDLDEYSAAQVDALRRAVGVMHEEMGKLRREYSMKRPRDHPMTSRVDLDSLSLFAEDRSDEVEGMVGDNVGRRAGGKDLDATCGGQRRAEIGRDGQGGPGIDGAEPPLDLPIPNADTDIDGGEGRSSAGGTGTRPPLSPPPLAEKDLQNTTPRSPGCLTMIRARLQRLLHIEKTKT